MKNVVQSPSSETTTLWFTRMVVFEEGWSFIRGGGGGGGVRKQCKPKHVSSGGGSLNKGTTVSMKGVVIPAPMAWW